MPKPGPGMPHGIYVYRDGDWRLYRRDGEPLKPGELGDGTYVIYFYNIQCPACRMFTPQWIMFSETVARKHGDRVKLLIVLCDWFSKECTSKAAAETFDTMDIHSTPTVVVVRVEDSKQVDQTTLPGYMKADDLYKIVKRYI